MPTGYTAAVVDGKVTDFPTFALQCARAFGALNEMRDDPPDKPIPDAFEPSTFAERQAVAARARLAELEAMPAAEVVEAYLAKCEEVARENEERERRAAEKRGRLNAMLSEVYAWAPPTSKHVELKNFMVQQLTETIRWDGEAYLAQVPGTDARTWHTAQVADANRVIEHYEKSQREETERTAGRNEWVRALRESLAQPAGTP